MANQNSHKSKSSSGKPMHDIWQKNPEIVQRFIELRPDYEQLCAEVQYTLRKRITEGGIEVSTITARAKTLNSFLEKKNVRIIQIHLMKSLTYQELELYVFILKTFEGLKK
jgi:hypothetical protein